MVSLYVVVFILVFQFGVVGQDTNAPKMNRPLKIKKKPSAPIDNCYQSEGTTRVRVTLDKSGKVTAVALVIESGCNSFDKNVLSAAKKIKFEPEIKNGEPITVTKLFEYKFRKF